MHASNTLVALAALNGLPMTGAGHESIRRVHRQAIGLFAPLCTSLELMDVKEIIL